MSQPAIEAVQRYLDLPEGGAGVAAGADGQRYLFANQRQRPLTPRDVRRIVDRRSPSPTHPHALRHTFATHLWMEGPIYELCRNFSATPT